MFLTKGRFLSDMVPEAPPKMLLDDEGLRWFSCLFFVS
jgi:hypothetical protein